MTETETETIISSPADQELARQAEKFAVQENHFVELERNIATLRAFFETHRNAFAPFVWSCYGWELKIAFWGKGLYGQKANDPKAIAAAFGATGWKRETDPSKCGQINWVKELDGIQITINGAEFLKPNLIPEVKL